MLPVRNLIIFNDMVQNIPGNRTVLTGAAVLNRAFDVLRQMLIGLDAEALHRIRDPAYFYFTHRFLSFAFVFHRLPDSSC